LSPYGYGQYDCTVCTTNYVPVSGICVTECDPGER
jgi:hypothetical protein